MKNPNSKRKLRAVLVAALCGVVLSLGLSLYIQNYSPVAGKDDLFLALILLIPTAILSNILGLEQTTQGRNMSHSFAFMAVSNVLLITFIFVVFACFWQFVVKRGDENEK
jgi:hypothetical protein